MSDQDEKIKITHTELFGTPYVDVTLILEQELRNLKIVNINLEAKLATKALETIGCNKTFHSLGGIDDCDVCLALFKIRGVSDG